jgi:DNA polymerase III epsilon subunit-like protein
MSNFLVCMDSETGSLRPKNGDILTLFMAVVDEDFKLLDELDLKLKPNDRLPIAEPGALEVNKIDLQKHMADPTTLTYKEARLKITEFIKKYLKKRGRYSNLIPLGQNVSFDLKFIWEYIIPEEEWENLFSYNVEDTKTASLFLKRCGWLPKELGTLKSLVEYFNIPKREAHEAKGDVHMTLDVYKKLIELMASKKENGSSQDLISLLESE